MEQKVSKFEQWNVAFESFNSTSELLDVSMGRTKMPGFSKDSFGGKEEREDSWTGCKGGMKTAMQYLEGGWSEKVESITADLHDTQRKLNDVRRMKLKQNVVGYIPIVPNALQGLPNSMLDLEIKPIKNKVIDLLYNNSFLCNVDADDILKSGLTTMKYVMKLEQQGFRVRLTQLNMYCDGSHIYGMMVRVKNEYQPMDVQRCMFPMLHPGMFRLVSFGWYERCPITTYMDGYGHELLREMNQEKADKFLADYVGKTATIIFGDEVRKKGEEYITERLKNIAK